MEKSNLIASLALLGIKEISYVHEYKTYLINNRYIFIKGNTIEIPGYPVEDISKDTLSYILELIPDD